MVFKSSDNFRRFVKQCINTVIRRIKLVIPNIKYKVRGSIWRNTYVSDVDLEVIVSKCIDRNKLSNILKLFNNTPKFTVASIGFNNVDHNKFHEDICSVLKVDSSSTPEYIERLTDSGIFLNDDDLDKYPRFVDSLIQNNKDIFVIIHIFIKNLCLIVDLTFSQMVSSKTQTVCKSPKRNWKIDKMIEDYKNNELYWSVYNYLSIIKRNVKVKQLEKTYGYFPQIIGLINTISMTRRVKGKHSNHINLLIKSLIYVFNKYLNVNTYWGLSKMRKYVIHECNKKIKTLLYYPNFKKFLDNYIRGQ